MLNSQSTCIGKSGLNRNTLLSLILETLLHEWNPVDDDRSINTLTYLQDQGLQIKWFKSVT